LLKLWSVCESGAVSIFRPRAACVMADLGLDVCGNYGRTEVRECWSEGVLVISR
jgi:hypothetical protein